MITRYHTTTPGSPVKEKETKGDHEAHAEGEACRCKTVSTMTPRELIKLMIDDLSFWKKGKKNPGQE